MNFIGHAAVALWRSAEPAYVLGSMLPDFASMMGTRLAPLGAGTRLAPDGEPAGPDDRALAQGIALHHRTDDAFHGEPWFTGLVQQTLDALAADGVPRGAARAVGHIGVEMLIDGELLRRAGVACAYTAALASDAAPAFAAADGAQRWQALRARLRWHGPPHDYRDLERVLERLTHVLARRPRLALDAPARDRVRTALPALQDRVIDGIDALLAQLRARLHETVEEL